MSQDPGIAPLRSLVAIADCGGFRRGATALHLSQATVSQHMARLESSAGQPLIERVGRSSRLTAAGEEMLTRARPILVRHDETLRMLGVGPAQALVIGTAQPAVAQLLPELVTALRTAFPATPIRFRVDRGPQLRSALTGGRIDLVLLLGPEGILSSRPIGDVGLTWCSAPGVFNEPVPLVTLGEKCALRRRALSTLPSSEIAASADHLLGVQALMRARRGAGLMLAPGPLPNGLIARDDLPQPAPLRLSVVARRGLPPEYAAALTSAELLPDPARNALDG